MKGADAALRARGVEPLRAAVAEALPALAAEVGALELDDVKLLDVRVARLTRWYAHGLLCIGDAAHAMSPVGGVGVNLAVQDGVAAARAFAGPLAAGRVGARELRAVQRRRMLPAVVTQAVQGVLHRALLPAVRDGSGIRPPDAMRLLFGAVPALSAIPARLIGVGIRPEHAPAWARR
jgi:2-polyprenyl-6-methoxyphenol hydroxylase-like FAD-dependent oxidoreductase